MKHNLKPILINLNCKIETNKAINDFNEASVLPTKHVLISWFCMHHLTLLSLRRLFVCSMILWRGQQDYMMTKLDL